MYFKVSNCYFLFIINVLHFSSVLENLRAEYIRSLLISLVIINIINNKTFS